MVFGTKPRKTSLLLFPCFEIRPSIEGGGMWTVVKNHRPHHIKNPHISVFLAYQNLISRPLIFLSCLISMESMWNPLSIRVLRKNVSNVKFLKPLWDILDSVPSFPKTVHYSGIKWWSLHLWIKTIHRRKSCNHVLLLWRLL